MKNWKIPVTYSILATVSIEADTLKEAIEIADGYGIIPIPGGFVPLPDNGDYVEDSWSVYPDDLEDIRYYFNDNQKDDR